MTASFNHARRVTRSRGHSCFHRRRTKQLILCHRSSSVRKAVDNDLRLRVRSWTTVRPHGAQQVVQEQREGYLSAALQVERGTHTQGTDSKSSFAAYQPPRSSCTAYLQLQLFFGQGWRILAAGRCRVRLSNLVEQVFIMIL